MNSRTYETRARRSSVWLPLTEQELRDSMERNHMRYSELMSHIEDLDAGHVLSADNGREYRAAQCTPSADKCPVHGYASCPLEDVPELQHDDEPRRFELSIALDGAAIEDDLTGELTRMLQLVIERLSIGVTEGTLRDTNGVTKGHTRMTDTKEK